MLIGVSGKKQAGKDTFFEFLSKRIKGKYQNKVIVKHYAFAAAVKEFSTKYFHVDLATPETKEKNRFVLQGVGQMFRDEVNEDFWINKVDSQYKEDILFTPEDDILLGVVTDLRYRNELDWVTNNGGILVRISRDNESKDSHPSETELSDEDFLHVIYNDESLEKYRMSIFSFMDKYILPEIERNI